MSRHTAYYNLVYGRVRARENHPVTPFRHALEMASTADLLKALQRLCSYSGVATFRQYRIEMISGRFEVLHDLGGAELT